ncbi:MAG: hypothetical protein JJ992_27015 [Planctomycetes bacterium]|nr:hypothetical protein [Planctomycetota bacterium]
MSSSEKKTQIIERFVAHCQRSASRPLGFLEVDENVYDCPSEPAEVVSALTSDFSIEDLLDSGLLVTADSEEVALAPALAGEGSFIVLRDAASRQPYDLLARTGCLTVNALPVFEILRDGLTQHFVERGTGELIVAFDLEHVILLRACGLPATLAVGLDNLPLESIDRFCESFGLTHRAYDRAQLGAQGGEVSDHQAINDPADPLPLTQSDTRDDDRAGTGTSATYAGSRSANGASEVKQMGLVLLGWSPLKLSADVSPQHKAVVDYLLQLERHMEVEVYEIGSWQVDEATLARLRFIAIHGHSAYFQQALLDAADDIGTGINSFDDDNCLATGPPEDYPTALSRLRDLPLSEEVRAGLGQSQSEAAWRHCERLLDQQVVAPLRESALAKYDPLQRALLMGCSELTRLFHMQSVTLGSQLSRRIADRGVDRGTSLSKGQQDQFKNLMATADRFIGMAKAAKTWNPTPTTIIESAALNPTNSPRLPHSG